MVEIGEPVGDGLANSQKRGIEPLTRWCQNWDSAQRLIPVHQIVDAFRSARQDQIDRRKLAHGAAGRPYNCGKA